MTCKDCIHHDVCFDNGTLFLHYATGRRAENAETNCPFKNFKNKADFIEVVRCAKCKYGDVSTISKAKDGEEEIACYCTLKKVVTNTDSYCPSGRRRDAE